MKIAITGSEGFIGSRLARKLTQAGHQIVPIDTAGTAPIDLLDQNALTRALSGCDAVYHLAAAHRDDIFPRSIYYDVNVTGTQNIIQSAQKNGINRIIFTSSFAVYGLSAQTPDERTPPAPFNDYGHSKLAAEHVLKKWAEESPDHKLTIIRPVVVFGEGNRGNVHTLIDQIARQKFLMIGSGKNKKSLAYVDNVVDFLAHTLGFSHQIGLYNYADKPDLTTEEMISLICTRLSVALPKIRLPYVAGLAGGYMFDGLSKVTGKRFPISSVRIQKFCADTTCSAEACRQTGFTPLFSLSDGLNRMIESDFIQSARPVKTA
jgi:nucleoside-diphosphate-sugar epimerase